MAVAAGLAAAAYAVTGDDHPRRIAGAALLGALNGVWLAVPLGVPLGLLVPWTGRATGALAQALPHPMAELLTAHGPRERAGSHTLPSSSARRPPSPDGPPSADLYGTPTMAGPITPGPVPPPRPGRRPGSGKAGRPVPPPPPPPPPLPRPPGKRPRKDGPPPSGGRPPGRR
ncbi:streptophobe family protein [Streptomyces sp. NPDC058067]|uniref:streptophobe family protein n=1 Tax=Streptomyces sp. NPDC058067 TaxID=3346324 RepID=UPI0036E3C83C